MDIGKLLNLKSKMLLILFAQVRFFRKTNKKVLNLFKINVMIKVSINLPYVDKYNLGR